MSDRAEEAAKYVIETVKKQALARTEKYIKDVLVPELLAEAVNLCGALQVSCERAFNQAALRPEINFTIHLVLPEAKKEGA